MDLWHTFYLGLANPLLGFGCRNDVVLSISDGNVFNAVQENRATDGGHWRYSDPFDTANLKQAVAVDKYCAQNKDSKGG